MSGARQYALGAATNGRVSDLSGVRFGKLIAHDPVAKRGTSYVWLCECDCGMFALVSAGMLTLGRRGSCQQYGCEEFKPLTKYRPVKWLKRHPETMELIPSTETVQKQKATTQHVERDNFGDLGARISENFQRQLSTITVGDEIKFSTGVSGKFGVSATVLAIEDKRLLIRTRKGKVRRIPKRMVRFGNQSNCGGQNAAEG